MNAAALPIAVRPGHAPGRLAFCVAISLGLHALALVGLDRPRSLGGAETLKTAPLQVGLARPATVIAPPSAASAPRSEAPRAAAPPETRAGTDDTPALPLPGIRYHRSDELTKAPRVIVPPDLDNLRLPGMPAGHVDLVVFIDESGRVTDVVVVDSDLPPALVRYTAKAFRGARFEPGWIGERAVPSQVVIAVGSAAGH